MQFARIRGVVKDIMQHKPTLKCGLFYGRYQEFHFIQGALGALKWIMIPMTSNKLISSIYDPANRSPFQQAVVHAYLHERGLAIRAS